MAVIQSVLAIVRRPAFTFFISGNPIVRNLLATSMFIAIAVNTNVAGATPAGHALNVRMHAAAEREQDAWAFLSQRTVDPASVPRHEVTTLADSGPGSLRDAIERANAEPGIAVVEIDAALEGTLQLAANNLYITDSVVIVGPGADRLAIDAGGRGGVIAIATYGFETIDVAILGLTIRGGAQDRGAGIKSSNARLLLADAIVEDNNTTNSIVDEQGGGLHLNGGSLRVDRCIFRHNSAGVSGGGIAALNAAVSIQDSLFQSNIAKRGAGLYIDTPYAFDMRRSLVAFNRAGRRGAGIDLTASDTAAVIENVTISGNFVYGEQATDGGAGIALTGSARIALSTIASNLAYTLQRNPNVAAGLQFDSPNGILFLNGTLLWGNATLDGNYDLGRSGSGGIEAYSNLIGTTTPGAIDRADNYNLHGVDPLLGALEDNGGPTQTQALAANSPARDAATWIQYYALTDQRGFSRRLDGDPRMDIGAYEYGADRLFASGFDG